MCKASHSNEIKPRSRTNGASTSDEIVPTFRAETEPKLIDFASVTISDLASMKNDDAFMYYSIPAVKKASMRAEEVDASDLVDREAGNSVTRESRLSMECHAGFLLEELLSGELLNADSIEEDVGVDLYDYLFSFTD